MKNAQKKNKRSKYSVLEKVVFTAKVVATVYVVVSCIFFYKHWESVGYTLIYPEDVKTFIHEKGGLFKGSSIELNNPNKIEAQKEEKVTSLPQNLKELIKGTPMEKMESALLTAQKERGVSPYLIVGIAKAESTMCKSFVYQQDRYNWNCWGIKPKGGKREDGSYLKWYANPKEAVDDVARQLRENYIDKGLDTEEKIMQKFVGPEDYRWVATVKSITSLESKELALK